MDIGKADAGSHDSQWWYDLGWYTGSIYIKSNTSLVSYDKAIFRWSTAHNAWNGNGFWSSKKEPLTLRYQTSSYLSDVVASFSIFNALFSSTNNFPIGLGSFCYERPNGSRVRLLKANWNYYLQVHCQSRALQSSRKLTRRMRCYNLRCRNYHCISTNC